MARLPLTPAEEGRLVGAIHHGAGAESAAGLVGIPPRLFAAWLRRGRRTRRGPAHAFYLLVEQAKAQARARAEMKLHDDDLQAWLRHGPGREELEREDAEDQSLLANLEFNRLVSLLLRLLEGLPEAQRVLREAFRRGAGNAWARSAKYERGAQEEKAKEDLEQEQQ